MQRVLADAEHVAGPVRQQVDPGLHHQPAERLGQATGGGGVQQQAQHFATAFVAQQLWTNALKVFGYFLPRPRHIPGTQAFCNQRDFCVITILIREGQMRIAIAQVCG
ncbi:hypothetical protein D3C84_792240 [compost metagenome]